MREYLAILLCMVVMVLIVFLFCFYLWRYYIQNKLLDLYTAMMKCMIASEEKYGSKNVLDCEEVLQYRQDIEKRKSAVSHRFISQSYKRRYDEIEESIVRAKIFIDMN